MKVISVDNYDRDDDCQLLIAGPGLTPAEAKRIADEHNDQTEDGVCSCEDIALYLLGGPPATAESVRTVLANFPGLLKSVRAADGVTVRGARDEDIERMPPMMWMEFGQRCRGYVR